MRNRLWGILADRRWFNIANYLISHYKGKYRVKCEYDKTTNQFSRKLDDTYEDIDCYIDCYHNIKIFYYGKAVLEAYIPSKVRGHNIVKAIEEELGQDIIYNKEENDAEVLFQFKAKNLNILEKYLRPKTSGANISPFSSRNLPKNKTYKIPDEDLAAYKIIIGNLGEKQIITLTHITNNYLKTLVTKRHTWEDIKADMALKGLSGKNYIHSIGMWNDYNKYLEKSISKKWVW